MSHTLEDLRTHLFETLASLRDKTAPMEIDRAKAISEVAKTVIDSARVEVDYVKATGNENAQLPVFGADQAKLPAPGGATVRTHRIK